MKSFASGLVSRVRDAAAGAATAANQLTSAPREVDAGKGATAARFHNATRRTRESMLQAAGQGKGLPDETYVARKAAFEEMVVRVAALQKALNSFLAASQSLPSHLSDAFSELTALHTATQMRGTSVPPGADGGSTAGALAARSTGLAGFESFRLTHDRRFITEVLDPLRTLDAQLPEIRACQRERELVKLDLDARTRKLKALKDAATASSSSHDPRKVLHKEEKTRLTAETLAGLDARVYGLMDGWESTAAATIDPVTRSLQALLRGYFDEAAAMVGGGGPSVGPPLPDKSLRVGARMPAPVPAASMPAYGGGSGGVIGSTATGISYARPLPPSAPADSDGPIPTATAVGYGAGMPPAGYLPTTGGGGGGGGGGDWSKAV